MTRGLDNGGHVPVFRSVNDIFARLRPRTTCLHRLQGRGDRRWRSVVTALGV